MEQINLMDSNDVQLAKLPEKMREYISKTASNILLESDTIKKNMLKYVLSAALAGILMAYEEDDSKNDERAVLEAVITMVKGL